MKRLLMDSGLNTGEATMHQIHQLQARDYNIDLGGSQLSGDSLPEATLNYQSPGGGVRHVFLLANCLENQEAGVALCLPARERGKHVYPLRRGSQV